MKKRKGFTLIELLAVIVILSLVAMIAIPMILNVIESSRKGAYEESLRNLLKATEYYEAREELAGNSLDFEEGISVFDANIEMKNKNFIAGNIKKNEQGELYLDMVSDGNYCGMGTIDKLNVTKGSCGDLDTTVPSDIVITENLVTSNAITIAVSVTTGHSGVKYYEYSKDGGSTYISSTNSSYTFTGLTKDTDYLIKVRVTGGNNLTGESEVVTIHTSDVEVPTYAISPVGDVWVAKKTVIITYPEIEGYKKEYSIDKGVTWIEINGNTKEIEFTENGTVIARMNDGVNEIVGESLSVLYVDGKTPILTPKEESVEVSIGFNKEVSELFDIESGPSGYTISCNYQNRIFTNVQTLPLLNDSITCTIQNGSGLNSSVTIHMHVYSDYVEDGLVLWYDGLNHGSDKTIWKDLSGNGNDGHLKNFQFTDESNWTGKGLYFDGIDDEVTITGLHNLPVGESPYTLEVAFDWQNPVVGEHDAGLLYLGQKISAKANGFSLSNAMKIGHVYWGNDLLTTSTFELGKAYTITGKNGGSLRQFFINGALDTEDEATPNTVLNDPCVGRTRTKSYLHEEVYGIRVYNRALTDEEIRQNHLADKKRYGF